jgi:hypothetical protein
MVLSLIGSVAGHAVWGYMSQMMDLVSSKALVIIGPVWSSVSRIADSSRGLADRVTGLLGSLPGVGGRRLAEAAAAEPDTVGALLSGAGAGAAGAARALQQAGGGGGMLGQIVQGIASGITAAAQAIPAAQNAQGGGGVIAAALPQLLPNGAQNPLFNAISNVTDAIQNQILNPTGCPIYCIDLRGERWWSDTNTGGFFWGGLGGGGWARRFEGVLFPAARSCLLTAPTFSLLSLLNFIHPTRTSPQAASATWTASRPPSPTSAPPGRPSSPPCWRSSLCTSAPRGCCCTARRSTRARAPSPSLWAASPERPRRRRRPRTRC